MSTLRALKWNVEEDAFTEDTPYGPKKFTNVIATKDPDAPMKLVLAAHFDSKYYPSFPENQVLAFTLLPFVIGRYAKLHYLFYS